ncbi:MAG: 3-hydroxyisobutyrate dehydrogenase [Solirubrobacterales bacterium]|nr:3-hydroxyisobutyrate dehydrogenase [Solirubrobacterales bacterium]
MGKGMARNLARAGMPVRAWNRTGEKIADLGSERGVTPCATVAEAVAAADVVLTMLSDADAVLTAAEDAAPAAAGGTLWLQASTIGIAGIERCAELAASSGLVLVDAPVLGTKQPAEEGQLVVLASGPEEARESLAPVFDAIAKRTMWVGEAGAGSRVKVVVNSWLVSIVEGTAEMLSLAEGLGIDPRLAIDAVAGGPLDLPYLEMKAKAMLERDFTPSFRLALAAKDADLAASAAAEAGLELPMLEAVCRRFAEAAREHGDEDLAAVYLASSPTA